jgi:phi13 family phage major tail protein
MTIKKMELQLFAETVPVNIKNFCYAKLIPSTGAYETPVTIPGLMEVKLEMKVEESKLSGDGKTRVIVNTEGDINIESTLNKFPLKDQAALLGRTYDATKGTLLKKEGDIAPYVATGFEIENEDGTSAFTWLYKGKFAQPSESFKQKEEGKVTFATPTLKGTFIADADGYKGIVMDESEGTDPPANFLGSVYKPIIDLTAPTVTSVPIDGATGVLGTANLVLTFNKAILAETATSANIFVMKADGTAVPATLSINDPHTIVTIDPIATMTAGDYILIATTGVKSAAAGVNMAERYIVNFTV